MMSMTNEAIAARLCALVFFKGKTEGRFLMEVEELTRASDLPRSLLEAAMAWAAERDWLHIRLDYVELKAAGIHIAKALSGFQRPPDSGGAPLA
jgi:hypothetical protein